MSLICQGEPSGDIGTWKSDWNYVGDCLPGIEQFVVVIFDGDPIVCQLIEGVNGDLEWNIPKTSYVEVDKRRIEWWMPIPTWPREGP